MTTPTPTPTPAARTDFAGGGVVAAILAALAAADQVVAEHAELAARLRSSPIWGLLPLLVLLGYALRIWTTRWRATQAQRAAEAAASAAAAAALTSQVKELRADLHGYADKTDGRLRDHDTGLRAVQAEVSTIAARVGVLERKRKRGAPR